MSGPSTLATFDPLFALDDVVINGRYVFANALYAALLDAGAIERLVVFGDPDANRVAATRSGLARHLGRIELHPLHAALRVLAGRDDVLALHTALDKALIGPLVEARALLGDRPLPVTATVHGVGYARQHGQLLQVLLADRRPGDAIICPSPSVHRTLTAIWAHFGAHVAASTGGRAPTPPEMPIVPHGIDPAVFRPRPAAATRAALDLPDRPMLLHVGRLSPANKLDLRPVLAALAPLWTRAPAPLLVVVVPVDGRHRRALDAEAARLGVEVRWVFDPPRAQLAQYYGAADVVLALSDTVVEMFGLTVLEAMAVGAPIVATAVGGYRDLIRHGANGLLVPVTTADRLDVPSRLAGLRDGAEGLLAFNTLTAIDHGALLDACRALLDDRARAAALGAAAARDVARHFAWPVVARRYVEMWLAGYRAASEASPRPTRPLSVDYAAAFGPNLSPPHTEQTAFVARVDAESFAVEWWPAVAEPIRAVVDRALVAWLLDRPGSWRVATLDRATAPGAPDRGALLRAALWALKQGLVEVAADAAAR